MRTADNFVDQHPQDISGLQEFIRQTNQHWGDLQAANSIVNDFLKLARHRQFKKNWVQSFLQAMQQDTFIREYQTYADLEQYMYGSADVIGLMMAQIMKLPPKALEAAGKQGRAMQLINFIRDIKEDWEDYQRIYMPLADRQKLKLTTWGPPTTKQQKKKFAQLINLEIKRYQQLQNAAAAGYQFLPKKYRLPIQTAAQMYEKTATVIAADPLIVWQKAWKPSKAQVVSQFFNNWIGSW